jgi:hypothetical protein
MLRSKSTNAPPERTGLDNGLVHPQAIRLERGKSSEQELPDDAQASFTIFMSDAFSQQQYSKRKGALGRTTARIL